MGGQIDLLLILLPNILRLKILIIALYPLKLITIILNPWMKVTILLTPRIMVTILLIPRMKAPLHLSSLSPLSSKRMERLILMAVKELSVVTMDLIGRNQSKLIM